MRQGLRPGQLVCFYPGRIFTDLKDDALPPGDQLFTNEYEGVHLDALPIKLGGSEVSP